MEVPSQPSAKKHSINNNVGPSPATARDDDVGLVVARAKKAAASLWMMIHAENCTKTTDQCPHRASCGETKKLLAHVRSCASSPGFGCPDNVRGCDDAKKLLAHYRRCREIRTRQAVGKQLDRQGVVRKQHNCLICTFLARHATAMLDKALAITSDNVAQNNNSGTKKRASTNTLSRESSTSCASQLAGTLHDACRQRSGSYPEKTSAESSAAVDNSLKSRQRSTSCSTLLSNNLTYGGCDTIEEEEDNESSAVR